MLSHFPEYKYNIFCTFDNLYSSKNTVLMINVYIYIYIIYIYMCVFIYITINKIIATNSANISY